MAKLYVGMSGVKLIVDTGINLNGASKVALKVKKPDGTEVEWIGTASGTKIEYVLQDGDLDQTGAYKIQAYVEFGTSKMYGDTEGIYVYDKYE